VRLASEQGEGASSLLTAAMAFDEEMTEAERTRLGGVINSWSMGPESISQPHRGRASLPPTKSPCIPGLLLDEETDPSIRIGEEVALELEGGADPPDRNRRERPRRNFQAPVIATGDEGRRVLMGRDLSAGGMRVERLSHLHVGDEFRLALYGPSESGPFEIQAKVVRDDGENGFALTFQDVPTDTATALEKVVACLPEVESLEDGETRGLGAVISEILDDRWRLG
jgi:hypothetical protein